MSKNTIIVLLVGVIIVYLYMKPKINTRQQMIDWLNVNISNGQGNWSQLTDEELITVYCPLSLVKKGAAPTGSQYLMALDVLKKYNIKLIE